MNLIFIVIPTNMFSKRAVYVHRCLLFFVLLFLLCLGFFCPVFLKECQKQRGRLRHVPSKRHLCLAAIRVKGGLKEHLRGQVLRFKYQECQPGKIAVLVRSTTHAPRQLHLLDIFPQVGWVRINLSRPRQLSIGCQPIHPLADRRVRRHDANNWWPAIPNTIKKFKVRKKQTSTTIPKGRRDTGSRRPAMILTQGDFFFSATFWGRMRSLYFPRTFPAPLPKKKKKNTHQPQKRTGLTFH